MPLRSREQGRHSVGDTTRIASQAFSTPKLKGASLPPAIACDAAPERTIWYASPSACAAEEHAVESVNAGPVMPNSIEMWLAPAFAMLRGMVSGLTRFLLCR